MTVYKQNLKVKGEYRSESNAFPEKMQCDQ